MCVLLHATRIALYRPHLECRYLWHSAPSVQWREETGEVEMGPRAAPTAPPYTAVYGRAASRAWAAGGCGRAGVSAGRTPSGSLRGAATPALQPYKVGDNYVDCGLCVRWDICTLTCLTLNLLLESCIVPVYLLHISTDTRTVRIRSSYYKVFMKFS